jgi:hypothetical protein
MSSLPSHSHPSLPQLALFSVMRSAILGLAHIPYDSATILDLHSHSPWPHLSKFTYWIISYGLS